jgi:K+-transporting ATPase ATPase B chain
LRDVGTSTGSENAFAALILVWLSFTVLFANFADALAEGRGKAQAGSLRRMRKTTLAHVIQADGSTIEKPSTELLVGERCVVEAGELIPGDGEVIEGMALIDESVITGESAPVIRESGGDRSAVTGSTRVLSDRAPGGPTPRVWWRPTGCARRSWPPSPTTCGPPCTRSRPRRRACSVTS